MTSLQRWFNAQHPSDIEDYNDPARADALSDSADRFEITLNDDHGAQYVETHQLAVPPVPCLDAGELRVFSRLAARTRMLSDGEHSQGEAVVESVVRKAQMLLKCTHDALSEVGIENLGRLFAGPVDLQEDDDGNLAVHGRVREEDIVLDINEIDVRARYMQQPDADSASALDVDTWSYPAPDGTSDSEAMPSAVVSTVATPDASAEQQAAETSAGAETRQADSAAAAPAEPAEPPAAVQSGELRYNGQVQVPGAPQLQPDEPGANTAGAGDAPGSGAGSMRRIASWQHDKFTAKPTRSHFPQLSEINHLLDESAIVAAGGAAAVAPGVGSLDDEPPPAVAPIGSYDLETDRQGAQALPEPSALSTASSMDVDTNAVPGQLPLLVPNAQVGGADVPAQLTRSESDSLVEARSPASSASRSPVRHRHVFSAPAAMDRSSAGGDDVSADGADAMEAEPTPGLGAAESAGAESWVQPCVGAIDAAEALVLEPADCSPSIMSTGTADGWRETLDAPVATGSADPASSPAQRTNGATHAHSAGDDPAQRCNGSAHAHTSADSDDAAEVVPARSASGRESAALSSSSGGAGVRGASRIEALQNAAASAEAAHSGRECLPAHVPHGILVRSDDGTRSAIKQVLLERTPPLLLMHLNRFAPVATGARKHSAHIAFPFHLFMHPGVAAALHSAPDGLLEPVRYRLKAVIAHTGPRVDSGHYACFAWRPTAVVEAAKRALKWVAPGPSEPIRIPAHARGTRQRGRRSLEGRRSCDGHRPRSQQYGAGTGFMRSSVSPAVRQSSHLTHDDSMSGRDSESGSARTSLDGAWRAVSAAQPVRRASKPPAAAHPSGSLSGSMSGGLLGGSAKLYTAESLQDGADSVDWEELADQPVELDPRSSSQAGALPSQRIDSSRSQSDGSRDAGNSALQSTDAAAGAEGSDADGGVDTLPVGQLLAHEAQDDLGVWVKCNDETVTTVHWHTVAKSQAYMLMYERV